MTNCFVGLMHRVTTRNKTLILSSIFFVLLASTAYSQAPTVTTPTVSGITTTDATLGGTVTGTLTHRGTRWSTTSPVGTSNELEEASATAGAFTQARTSLPSAARIFFVAYARNNADAGTTSETVFVTEPLQLSGGQLTVTANGSTTIDLTFPSANSWVGTGATAGYVIYRNTGSAPSLGTLADGAAPPADGTGHKITTITSGAATSFNDTGLTSGTDYYYTIIPFAWDGTNAATYNYNLTAPQTANDFTFATEPSGHATGTLTATAMGSNQINLSFNSIATSGITNATGYVVLIKNSAIVAADLAALTDGAAPNSFGLFKGIINGTGISTYNDMTGLSANTTYHYAIIPFNRGADDETYNFLITTGFPTGSATTSDFSATFTPISPGTAPVISTTILEAGSTAQVVLGFSVTSEGTQVINDLNFSYTGLTSQITNEYIYYGGTTPGTLGSQILNDNSPDGSFSFASVAAGDKTIDATPRYYYLVLDVSDNVTASTNNINIQLNQGGVVVATGAVNTFSTSRSFTFNTSQESDIIFANDGTTAAIAYRSYQGTSIGPGQPAPPNPAASVSLGDFIIRDGGSDGTDSDNKSTNVTSITISITNPENVRQIALFDDNTNTEISGTEQTVSGSSVVFTPSSPIIVPDDGTFRINVRATFLQAVTDNHQIHIAITNVTSASNTSGFAASNGGGATTTGTTNVITVIASKLIFSTFPTTSPVNTNFSVVVRAVDSNPYNNIDLDYSGQISLSKTSGPTGTLTAGGGESLTPTLSSGQYTWNQLRINGSGNFGLEASDDAYADAIGDASSTISITSSPSTVTIPATLSVCYGGDAQTLGNIVITETDQSGFSTSGTFTVSLPGGFQFDQTITTAPTFTGAGISISALSYPTANVAEFTITLTAAAATSTNSITIGGLKIHQPHPGTQDPTSTSGTITRAGGTATIAGVVSGTTLGNVSVSETGPDIDFTVVKINPGDVDVGPGETRFSQNSNPVRLVGSPAGGGTGTVFSGAGVTFVAGQYRFNPQALSPGTYPITFKYKDASAPKCEKIVIKNFEVYTTNITYLNAQYCNNDPQTQPMNVDSYLAAFYPQGDTYQDWELIKFIYWNTPTFSEVDITSPANNIFDPKLSEYQINYSATGGYYGIIGIWIGFEIGGFYDRDGAGVLYSPIYQTRKVWQLIPVRPAPKPSFSLPNNDYEFCDDEAPVTLTGSPPNSNTKNYDFFTPGNGQNSSVTSTPSGTIVWSFNPLNVTDVTVGTTTEIPITYTYRDPSTGCTGTSDPIIIKVNKRPVVTLADDIISAGGINPQICQGEDIPEFLVNPDSDITYKWYSDFDLKELVGSGYSFKPPIDNNVPAVIPFFVTKESAGCQSAGANISIAVRNLPKIDFTWQNACLGTATTFVATENSTPPLSNLTFDWEFSLNNTLSHSNSPNGIHNPNVNYTSSGTDIIKLVVNTPFDCRDTVSKPVYIVPKVVAPITVSTPYTQDFNTDEAGWIAGGTNSSWEWGTLLKKGTEANATRGSGWETMLNGTNNQEEQSWVLSNCFDIASTKPVISLDIFSDTPVGVNGAVLQANTNGNIEDDGSWITIGAVNSGINWYDATGIVSSPGNQSTVNAGWSGNAVTRPNKYETWTTAIFKLDPFAGASNVVFRVAFGADKSQTDGFAFDNVFIGERTRVVVLENFTNNHAPGATAHNNDYHNLASEVVKVQYHTPFPGDDPVNALNPQINNARTAFYGLTEAPTIRIDGGARTGAVNTWLNTLYDERVLTPSPLEIVPTVTKINGEVVISTSILNRTGQTLSLQGAHVFTTIVQKSITDAALLSGTTNNEFVFVARQMLPSPTGVIIDNDIAANGTYTVPDVVWRFNSGDAIVITVQETSGLKEVYQAHIVLNPPLPDLVTGIEDLAEYIHIYPNPANESFEIELPTKAENRLMVNLIDPVGRAAQQLYFEKGEQTKTVNTQNLAQGIYVVQIGSGKTGVVRKKVMVVH